MKALPITVPKEELPRGWKWNINADAWLSKQDIELINLTIDRIACGHSPADSLLEASTSMGYPHDNVWTNEFRTCGTYNRLTITAEERIVRLYRVLKECKRTETMHFITLDNPTGRDRNNISRMVFMPLDDSDE